MPDDPPPVAEEEYGCVATCDEASPASALPPEIAAIARPGTAGSTFPMPRSYQMPSILADHALAHPTAPGASGDSPN